MDLDKKEVWKLFPGLKEDGEFRPDEVAGVANSKFSVKIMNIESEDAILRLCLERRYDWTSLMGFILENLTSFHNDERIKLQDDFEEDFAFKAFDEFWLEKFCGWGLTILLLDHPAFQSFLVLQYVQHNRRNLEIDPEELFNNYKTTNEKFFKKWISGPVHVDNCWLLKGPDADCSKKILRLTLDSFKMTQVYVNFLIEKFPLPRSLLNEAAKVIAMFQEDRFKYHYAR